MTDVDLAAIRERDGRWTDTGRRTDCAAACADRRELLQYIDALEADVRAALDEIGVDLSLIKRAHRAHYLAKPPPVAADIFEEQRADQRREARRQYDQNRKR